MKCPHCGGDMRQDQIFCEKCGKERLLVPVFEPEIEERVAESMSTIVQELAPDEHADDKIKEEQKEQSNTDKEQEKDNGKQHKGIAPDVPRHGFSHLVFFVLGIILLIGVISTFSIYFYVYTENSYEYQYAKALTAFEEGRFEDALVLSDRCLELDETSIEVRMLRIRIYQEQGETDKVLERCLSMLNMDPENQEVYEILISIYIEREEYLKLSRLLSDCPVQAVVEKYGDYRAEPPEFSEEERTYYNPLSLKLLAGGTGTVYYTLDGSEPSKYSDRYTAPIKLNSGIYHISAVYVNNYGISSQVVTKTYRIESGIELTPEISADSGSYDIPCVIKVNVSDEGYMVYYTTDGQDPTMDSNIYSAPFPMPLGHSEFRFMMVDEEGNESDVVKRVYDCNPAVNFTTEQACIILKQHLIARGEILDLDGKMNGTEDTKQYVCDSAMTADDVVYYMIYEYIRSASGTMIRSGNIYAFSVTDGRILRASVSNNGYLSLSEF